MHELDMTNDRANMAWTGEVPWHGLGQNVDATASLDEWTRAAGFDWEVRSAPAVFNIADSDDAGPINLQAVPNRNVLYRSDSGAALSVVSDRYCITQPRDVAEFFRELVEVGGFRMETMGMLDGGRKYWALARVDDEFDMGGDRVLPYLLLASSADGSMSNCADFTTVRVVCQNTLSYSIGRNGQLAKIRIPHSTHFNPEQVKTELGLVGASWDRFKKDAAEFRKFHMSKDEVIGFLLSAMYPKIEEEGLEMDGRRRVGLERLLAGYETGPGQDVAGAGDNLWRALNAVTLYTDHLRGAENSNNRLSSAWFGAAAAMKARAVRRARELIAA
jgi:phage/plasmid-like protein (TIGR03299 family)